MTPLEKFSLAGSLASILGLFVSIYVLIREYFIEEDVATLRHEEEEWHKDDTRN